MRDESRQRKRYWLLLLVPYVWMVFLIPLANTIRVSVFGIPFLEVWMMLGVIIVSGSIGSVWVLDRRIRQRGKET